MSIPLHGLPTAYSWVMQAIAWCRESALSTFNIRAESRFYGQGLNCGLEDVRVLNSFLELHGIKPETTLPLGETDPELERALADYSSKRKADLEAICKLALQN